MSVLRARHCGLDPQSRGVVQGGRHTGFKAVSTGRGGNKPNQPTESPSPLMGEESKVRVKTIRPTPSFTRRRESIGRGPATPSLQT